MKTFKYRIYPTNAQETILEKMLEECRWVYNKTLEIRKNSYEQQGVSLGLYDTQKLLTEWKLDHPTLKLVGCLLRRASASERASACRPSIQGVLSACQVW